MQNRFPPDFQRMTAAMIGASPQSRVQEKRPTELICEWMIMELLRCGYVAVETAPELDQMGKDGVAFLKANVLTRSPNGDPILSFHLLEDGYAVFPIVVFLCFFLSNWWNSQMTVTEEFVEQGGD